MNGIRPRSRYLTALLEIGILFLPAIPAYLWAWPNLRGAGLEIFQAITYVYILAGTLIIGLRRWNWDQLGVNWKGMGVVLGCGLTILVARYLIILSINWKIETAQLSLWSRVWDVFFYLFLVGLVEELLFRGLLFRLLEDWRSTRWAIWGSSFGFMLWHIFGHGPVAGLATFVIGLLFALLRWRAGGIVGLIVLHALWDIQTAWLVTDSNAEIFGNINQIVFTNQLLTLLGTILLFLVPLYLWKLYPLIHR